MTNAEVKKLLGFLRSGEYRIDCKCESCKAIPEALKSLLAEVDKQSHSAQFRRVELLQAEVERLKQGDCGHKAKDMLVSDCKLCTLALAEVGYPMWVEKGKKLQTENLSLKGEVDKYKGSMMKDLIDDNTRLREALKKIISSLPFGINDCIEITTLHESGGSGTMGPNLTKEFKEAIAIATNALKDKAT